MSVVKINAVTVPEGMGDDFMERFAKRAGSVESQPGFEEFLLLKPAKPIQGQARDDGWLAKSPAATGTDRSERMGVAQS